jgi:hypothetical protein
MDFRDLYPSPTGTKDPLPTSLSKLKTILTKSLVYPPLTEWPACHVRPTSQSSDIEGKWRRNLKYGREGYLSPLSSSFPQTFFIQSVPTPKVYPSCGPIFTSTSTNHDHAQIYFPFVSPFQIEPNRMCLYHFIDTKPSFPHSFPYLN